MSSSLKAPLGRLLFAPGQHKVYIDFIVYDNAAEMQAAARIDGEPPCAADMRACCRWDYDSEGPRYGEILMHRDDLSLGVLAHECTHAALCFAKHYVMQAEAVQAMSADAQDEYFDEATAQMVGELFDQALRLLKQSNEECNQEWRGAEL